MFNNSNDQKRRINSIAAAYNLGSQQQQQPMGPNATHLLQNSSLASSARLNTSTGSTASVLGANSSLTHALNSLQQAVSNNNSNNNSNNSHSLLSALSLSTSNTSNNNNNNSSNGHNMSHHSHHHSTSSSGGNNGNSSMLSSSATAALVASLNASGKPLRSERLPQQMRDDIIKQGRLRRKQGGKKEVCVFCRNNGENEQIYTSHTLKDAQNGVACPILRLYQCPICHASGDQAHTIKYCPFAEKESGGCMSKLLYKDNGIMGMMGGMGPNTPTSPHGASVRLPSTGGNSGNGKF